MPTSMSQKYLSCLQLHQALWGRREHHDSFPKAAMLCQEAWSPITKASGMEIASDLKKAWTMSWELENIAFSREPRLIRSYVTCRYGSSSRRIHLVKPKGIQMGSQFELSFPWKDVPVKGTILSSQVFKLVAHFLPAVKSKTNQNESSTCYL